MIQEDITKKILADKVKITKWTAILIEKFSKSSKCHMCNRKFNKPLMSMINKNPNVCDFNGEFLAHLHQTHGLHPEDFKEMVYFPTK